MLLSTLQTWTMLLHACDASVLAVLLQVVIPSSPSEAKGLLLASIRDPDPVVFFEPKMM